MNVPDTLCEACSALLRSRLSEKEWEELQRTLEPSQEDQEKVLKAAATPLSELHFSGRVQGYVKSSGFQIALDLCMVDEKRLKAEPNIGKASREEIKGKLAELGLRLGMKFPDDVIQRLRE